MGLLREKRLPHDTITLILLPSIIYMPEVPVLSKERKNDFAKKARDRLRDEIYVRSAFSSEDACILGSLYLAHYTEVFLHIEDMWVEERLTGSQGIHERRIELEAILFAAQNGNYVPLKLELLRQAEKHQASCKWDNWFVRYGKQLRLLARAIRDFDTPFQPPLPAWAQVLN